MKYIYVSLVFILFFITQVSADLGTFKQNFCVPITTTLNATSVTLTNVNSPGPNSTILLTNKAMTPTGSLFNYTFCNTSLLGTYTYGYCDGSGNCYGNSFNINGSGQVVSQSQITLIIIGLVVILIMASFFFILSLIFKHPGTKIFLMALSTVTMIVLIGIIASNAQVYLAEFPNIVSIYNQYYIVILSLAGAAMAGLMVWLIYYSFTLFNKSRGRVPDDD